MFPFFSVVSASVQQPKTLNGAVNDHNIRMYAPANQPPDFLYNVNDRCQKLTVWVGLYGNGDMLGPFFFDGNVNGQSY